MVLRDAETIQRLITRSSDQALETMAAVLKAIGKVKLKPRIFHCLYIQIINKNPCSYLNGTFFV